MTTQPVSTNELFAILLARDFQPTDRTFKVGANFPAARAATIYAALTTHPDTHIMLGLGWHSFDGTSSFPPVYPFTFDPRTLRAEAWMSPWTESDEMRTFDVFFIAGLQVDRRGNVNLFGIRDEQGKWKMRGPGGVGIASATTHASGYYIVMPNHDRRTFVEQVNLITALGDREERRRYRLPGGGPRMVLSPLGAFDFDDKGNMRIKSLHPGVTLDEVIAATGFEFDVTRPPPVTTPPTAEELAFLRTRVDIEGQLADRSTAR